MNMSQREMQCVYARMAKSMNIIYNFAYSNQYFLGLRLLVDVLVKADSDTIHVDLVHPSHVLAVFSSADTNTIQSG